MAETFPIKCTTCSEIVDAATHMVVGAAYNCPMCGADTAIPEAEDFDLPCPAEVVIEEQTPERLRFRVVDSPRGSDGFYLGRLFLGSGVVFLGCVLLLVIVDFDFPPRLYYLDDPIFLSMVGSCLLGTGVYLLTAARSLELAGNRATVRYYVLGLIYFRKRTRSTLIKSVYMVFPPANWPFRVWLIVIADGPRPHRRSSILAHNPDIARYVTHLIRRQLKTMGHELQDG